MDYESSIDQGLFPPLSCLDIKKGIVIDIVILRSYEGILRFSVAILNNDK